MSFHAAACQNAHTTCFMRSGTPDPSLKLTRYGRRYRPGPRQQYCREPGLQHLPTLAA
jgi:hypothetical protein